MTRSRITVAHSDGGWNVQMQGSKLSSHRTQAEAIDAARSFAQVYPSEVTVQGRDGKFRTGFTYGGVDPFPPRGQILKETSGELAMLPALRSRVSA